MAMLKQLLMNLITVCVAVFLLAMAVEQLYERNSPYEECVKERGVGSGYPFSGGKFYYGDMLLHCKARTHW